VYAYAATHHPELRLHRWTRAQWDAREAQLLAQLGKRVMDSRETPSAPMPPPTPPARRVDSRGTQPPPRRRARWVDGN